jgi:hypothetical protein
VFVVVTVSVVTVMVAIAVVVVLLLLLLLLLLMMIMIMSVWCSLKLTILYTYKSVKLLKTVCASTSRFIFQNQHFGVQTHVPITPTALAWLSV